MPKILEDKTVVEWSSGKPSKFRAALISYFSKSLLRYWFNLDAAWNCIWWGRNAWLNYWRWFSQSVIVAVSKQINFEIVWSFPKEFQLIRDFRDIQSKDKLDKFLIACWCSGRKLRGIFSNVSWPSATFISTPECLIVAFCFLVSFNPFHTKICFHCWTLIFPLFFSYFWSFAGIAWESFTYFRVISLLVASSVYSFAVYCNLLVVSLFITLWSLIKIWSTASVPVWEVTS